MHMFISLLVVFEATVGLLVLSRGGRTQLGLVGAMGFASALLFLAGSSMRVRSYARRIRATAGGAQAGPRACCVRAGLVDVIPRRPSPRMWHSAAHGTAGPVHGGADERYCQFSYIRSSAESAAGQP